MFASVCAAHLAVFTATVAAVERWVKLGIALMGLLLLLSTWNVEKTNVIRLGGRDRVFFSEKGSGFVGFLDLLRLLEVGASVLGGNTGCSFRHGFGNAIINLGTAGCQ